jgi:hypothetical protein
MLRVTMYEIKLTARSYEIRSSVRKYAIRLDHC